MGSKPFAWVFALMTSVEFPMVEIPNLELPRRKVLFPRSAAIIRHLGSSNFLGNSPIIIRKCHDCRTAKLGTLQSENRLISKFSEEFKFRQRWNRTRGILPVPSVPNFILADVLSESSSVADVRPRVRVTAVSYTHLTLPTIYSV